MKTQGKNKNVVFLSGVRTGYGDFGGTLKNFSATQLGTIASTHAVERSGVDAGDFDHVVFGNAQQTSADAIYLARHVGLQSGLPVETPAVTVNRLCGSGFEPISSPARKLRLRPRLPDLRRYTQFRVHTSSPRDAARGAGAR